MENNPTKELDYKAYNFDKPDEAKYYCRPIEPKP